MNFLCLVQAPKFDNKIPFWLSYMCQEVSKQVSHNRVFAVLSIFLSINPKSNMDQIQTIVLGAGVVGLAVARVLALEGHEVIVLESADAFGTGTSSRHSEVIHAGIYYPQGSLKASLCVTGRHLMYAYCEKRHVPHRRVGKLIVATSPSQVPQLAAIQSKSIANGVTGPDQLQWLSQAEAQAMEPSLHCEAALWSPSTGIVDSHALMLNLLGDFENAGGILSLNTAFESARVLNDQGKGRFVVRTLDGTELLTQNVINATGLAAPRVARQFFGAAVPGLPNAHFAKGNYFSLSGRSPFSRLIYPVPEAAGLGVHLTLDMAGQAKFGPDVEWVQYADDLTVDPARGNAFYAEVRRYWPDLQDGALVPSYAGIRPKINGPQEVAADFCIMGPKAHGVSGLVHLLGIESPGLTSSLAIAQHVSSLLSAAN
jgi:L-2-hydroxyglutarate oxidase LhgO